MKLSTLQSNLRAEIPGEFGLILFFSGWLLGTVICFRFIVFVKGLNRIVLMGVTAVTVFGEATTDSDQYYTAKN